MKRDNGTIGAACTLRMLLIVFAGFASCTPHSMRGFFTGGSDGGTVRVLLDNSSREAVVTSPSSMRIQKKGEASKMTRGPIVIRASEIKAPLTVEPGRSPLVLNGSPYRGSLTFHPAGGSIAIINSVCIGDYLISVVPGEIPSKWGREALKAQAVAARTYTHHHLMSVKKADALYDIGSTTNAQVYRGISVETPETTEAVRATAGEIIMHESRPIIAYFHSTCGGKTSDDRYVWTMNDLPYLKSVTCGYCGASTKFSWETKLATEELESAIYKRYRNIGALKNITFKKKGDRVVEVLVRHSRGSLLIRGNDFRLLFPPDRIRSLMFTSRTTRDGLHLSGHGWGHGVGMCQWGARGMAERGFGYRSILAHYYSGVRIATAGIGTIAQRPPHHSARTDR